MMYQHYNNSIHSRYNAVFKLNERMPTNFAANGNTNIVRLFGRILEAVIIYYDLINYLIYLMK